MAVDPSKLLDLAGSTMSKVPAKEFTNLLLRQGYIFETFLKALKARDMSGVDVTFSAMIKDGATFGDAEVTGFGRYGAYSVTPIAAVEYLASGRVPWAYYQGHWTLSAQEMALNSGKEAYQDLAAVKLEGAMSTFANGMEDDFWSPTAYLAPVDKPAILGPNYWITDDGYHVGDPGGTLHLPVGGIDPTSAAYLDAAGRNRWRNQFAQIATANELIDALDDLFVDCKFQAPPSVNANTEPAWGKFRIVMGTPSFKACKKILRRFKESFDEVNPSFNNVKMEMAGSMPARSDGTYETFFFNLGTWRAWVEKSHNWKKDAPFKPENQEAKAQRFYLWPAMACVDRRANGKVFGYGDLVEQ